MAYYRLVEPTDAARISSVHGEGEHHWRLITEDGRSLIVTHNWVREHQPVTVGDWLLFRDKNPPSALPDAVFRRLFIPSVRQVA